jgi:hypothetical protein
MPMPAFIPDDLPPFILFAVAGVDPAALLDDEIPAEPGGRKIRPGEAIGCAVQMTVNCHPGLVIASLRTLADQLERDELAERAERN